MHTLHMWLRKVQACAYTCTWLSKTHVVHKGAGMHMRIHMWPPRKVRCMHSQNTIQMTSGKGTHVLITVYSPAITNKSTIY